MKKLLLAGAALLIIPACSPNKSDDASGAANSATEAMDVSVEKSERAEPAATEAAADAAAGPPPEIDSNVAPGVAFDFAYSFSLPEAKIAAAQEGHARLCGRLGISRCRVTALEFNKERDGNVNAMMAFKVDPTIALSFGRDATDLIEDAEGKLETSSARGEDVGTAITDGDKSSDKLRAELKRIDVQLKLPSLSKSVRGQLVERQGEINRELSQISQSRDAQVESLATTPVRFDYEPNEAVLGFERGSALQTGLSTGAASMSAVTKMIAFALGAFGPWLLLLGAGYWAVRRFIKRPKAEAEVQ